MNAVGDPLLRRSCHPDRGLPTMQALAIEGPGSIMIWGEGGLSPHVRTDPLWPTNTPIRPLLSVPRVFFWVGFDVSPCVERGDPIPLQGIAQHVPSRPQPFLP